MVHFSILKKDEHNVLLYCSGSQPFGICVPPNKKLSVKFDILLTHCELYTLSYPLEAYHLNKKNDSTSKNEPGIKTSLPPLTHPGSPFKLRQLKGCTAKAFKNSSQIFLGFIASCVFSTQTFLGCISTCGFFIARVRRRHL